MITPPTFDDPFNIDLGPPPPPPYTLEKASEKSWDLYIDQEIVGYESYKDLVKFLKARVAGDVVNIHMNTPGGSVDGGLAIFKAIKNTKATININVEGLGAYSMGAILSCSSTNLTMDPGSVIMFHDFSVSLGGKGQDLIDMLDSLRKQMDSILANDCAHLLTPAELDHLHKGGNVFLQPSTIAERIKHAK